MKCVAFHSFKGGVGRTSAALNYARGLAVNGNKVVLLELDVDAPGISLKPSVLGQHLEMKGYVDYLSHFYDSEALHENFQKLTNPNDAISLIDRIHYLDQASLRMDVGRTKNGAVKIISSGSDNDRYWWNLNSVWFNKFFSVSRHEYSEAGRFHLHTNKDLFREEKAIFARVFSSGDILDRKKDLIKMSYQDAMAEIHPSTDYLIIDCKSAREYACVPLYYWCDIAVLMFPFNYEGMFNFFRMYRAVRSASESVRNGLDAVTICPVVCRTPPGQFSKNKSADTEFLLCDVIDALPAQQGDKLLNLLQSEGHGSTSEVLKQRTFAIQESSKVTTDEALFLDVKNADFKRHSRSFEWYPKAINDQAKIFQSLSNSFAEKTGAEPQKIDWVTSLVPRRILKNPRTDDVQQKDDDGIFYNEDQQPNVLLRRESMQLIMSSLSQAIASVADTSLPAGKGKKEVSKLDAALASFRDAGMSVGDSYAHSSLKEKKNDASKKSFLEMVTDSCEYDSIHAGFGQMKVIAAGEAKVKKIVWEYCFFVDVRGRKKLEESNGEPDAHLNGWGILETSIDFLEGYLTGGLRAMYRATNGAGNAEKITVIYDGARHPKGSDPAKLFGELVPLVDNSLTFKVSYG